MHLQFRHMRICVARGTSLFVRRSASICVEVRQTAAHAESSRPTMGRDRDQQWIGRCRRPKTESEIIKAISLVFRDPRLSAECRGGFVPHSAPIVRLYSPAVRWLHESSFCHRIEACGFDLLHLSQGADRLFINKYVFPHPARQSSQPAALRQILSSRPLIADA